ncbi:MAG: hypothetical protein EXR52_00485 [Dehalococcoidia bacterium]|nr:hypothetical protein [Dehalococcoidia bacterium]
MTDWQNTQRMAADSKHDLAVSGRPASVAARGVLSSKSQGREIRAAVYRKGDASAAPLFTVTTKRPAESRIVDVRDVEWEALRRLNNADFTVGAEYTT